MTDTLYPLSDQVIAYGTREEFERCRKQAGQWVFWEDRVELVLAGRYDEVLPLHVELSPTYLCNFACPWCSCRAAREEWVPENVFEHPRASEDSVMSRERLEGTVEHLAEHRVAIQWVGGEPTMNPALYPVVGMAHERGIQQCLFTNGSLLAPRRLDELLAAELVFIRISLDVSDERVHRSFHGYHPDRPYSERVLRNLECLVARAAELDAPTLVGISLVVDDRNIDYVVSSLRYAHSLCERHGAGAIDFAIVRPAHPINTAQLELSGSTTTRLLELTGEDSECAKLCADAGIELVAPRDSFQAEEPPRWMRDDGRGCLSCGWFGEVRPDGSLLLCSDRYGDPDYAIGSLATSPLPELWAGDGRRRALALARQVSCFRDRCPRNGRGFHLNKMFHTIEQLRGEGRIEEVRRWIEDLRRVLPAPEHPFFL